MFGVVLWCDAHVSKAVIWCEDHGDLAYFRRGDAVEPVVMDAGDWVQFEVTSGCDMRYAHNPRLVAEGVFSGLADNLKGVNASAQPGGRPVAPAAVAAPAAKILPFSPGQVRRGLRPAKTGRA